MWNNLENSSIFTPEQVLENRGQLFLLMARFMPRYNWVKLITPSCCVG